ncbi:MAG: LysM peptidoglycan-binding domain-containing protein [Rhizobiaceae bacterium]
MNQYKALMAGFAAVIGVGGIAAYNGAFNGQSAPTETVTTDKQPAAPVATNDAAKVETAPAEVAKVDPAKVEPEAGGQAAATDPAKAEPATTTAPAAATESTTTADPAKATDAATTSTPTAPKFDVLRVEPNGSVLIAGKAEKDAQVEVLSGAVVLGVTKAQANGDFAIVIENPLKPGDYQLVLRQTLPNGTAATSIETATVAVPEKLDGPVLALVEEPGKPSRIITAPASAEVAVKAEVKNPETPDTAVVAPEAVKPADAAEVTKPADAQVATQAEEPTAPAAPATPEAAIEPTVAIEAVETEGDKIFVAGSAKAVATVRVYANDMILGESKALPGDRFLVEVQKDMAAGDYIIKAEGLDADGVTVLGRSVVPFKAGAAEQVAIAEPSTDQKAADSQAPDTQAPEAEAPAAATPSAETAPEKKMAVVIRRGDTLWQISRRIYGRGVRYSTIYLANKDAINNPNKIFPGQVVTIPDTTPEGDAASADEIKKREVIE